MNDTILKIQQLSSSLIAEIQACYRVSNPLEELVVRQILQQAVELDKRIQQFKVAITTERRIE